MLRDRQAAEDVAAQATFLREHQSQFAALVRLTRADFATAERLARG
jgi:hypothetical protein